MPRSTTAPHRSASMASAWDTASGLELEWIGECPDASRAPDPVITATRTSGSPAIPDTTRSRVLLEDGVCVDVPDCGIDSHGPNWGAYPGSAASYRRCAYNVWLTPQPSSSTNEYPHEIGHALGFAHEHERAATIWIVARNPNSEQSLLCDLLR